MPQPVELPQSARVLPAGAQDLGVVAPTEPVSVPVYVRPNPNASAPFDVAAEALKPPGERRYLSADEANAIYGATSADIDAVRAFATQHGLQVVRVNQAARSVKLAGTATQIGDAFGVELHHYSH